MCSFARGILPLPSHVVLLCLVVVVSHSPSLLCWSCFLLEVVVELGPSLLLRWYRGAAGCCACTFFLRRSPFPWWSGRLWRRCALVRGCSTWVPGVSLGSQHSVPRRAHWESGMGCLLSPAVGIPQFASGSPLVVVGIQEMKKAMMYTISPCVPLGLNTTVREWDR